jgi:hypothetical protein
LKSFHLMSASRRVCTARDLAEARDGTGPPNVNQSSETIFPQGD